MLAYAIGKASPARRVAQGAAIEWQHAASQVLPVLEKHQLLSPPPPPLLSEIEHQRGLGLKAYSLLGALLLLAQMHRDSQANVAAEVGGTPQGMPSHEDGGFQVTKGTSDAFAHR